VVFYCFVRLLIAIFLLVSSCQFSFFFFFSSRRRHTRSKRDWSSDVCSSDLQVLLLNNAWTGLFILIGLFVGSWKVGLMALIASLISLLLAKHTNYSEEEINSGLAGFNPVLTAIALTLFLVPEWYSLLIVLVAIVITMPLGSAFREFFKPFGVPMLTMPYVFVSWVVLLMSFQFKFVNADVKILPNTVKEITFSGHQIDFISAFLSG